MNWSGRQNDIKIIDFISSTGESTRLEIVKFLGESPGIVDTVLSDLINDGDLQVIYGNNSSQDRFSIPQTVYRKNYASS